MRSSRAALEMLPPQSATTRLMCSHSTRASDGTSAAAAVGGALIATGSTAGFTFSTALGFLAVILASVNIFGGFIVTQRMLAMYKKKQKK